MKFSIKLIAATILTSMTTVAMATENTALSNLGLSFSGSAAITSDYRFRGITQTQNDPAIQAGFTLAHTSGLYFGLWGSNVDFGEDSPSLELDPSLGFATNLTSLPGKPLLDVGVLYYNYPSDSDLNWVELYGKLGFKDAIISGDNILTNVNYTNDYAGLDADSWNFNVGYTVPFGATGFGGIANVGYTTVDEDKYDFNGDDNYVDWKAGVTYGFKSVSGLTAELAAVGTNINTDDMSHALKRGVETGAVFTLTKAF